MLLRVLDLGKSFPREDGERLELFRGVNLSLSSGACLALTGPNGCGKTTLLNIIAGQLQPDEGCIEFQGANIGSFPPNIRSRFIGSASQDSYRALPADLTVYEALALASKRRATLSLSPPRPFRGPRELNNFPDSLVEFLLRRSSTLLGSLSGGQRQLVAFSCAIVGSPALLLLDEHLSSLDDHFSRVSNESFAMYLASGDGAAIVVSHDDDWINRFSTHIASFGDHSIVIIENKSSGREAKQS